MEHAKNICGFGNRAVLAQVKQVRHERDAKEAAQLLASGNWIAMFATINDDEVTFVLGRVG